jgi:hypothetical protein
MVLNDYATLYRKGMIASSLETGHYLHLLTTKNGIEGYDDIISGHISSGIKNIYPCTLSLKERIGLAKLMRIHKPSGISGNDIILDKRSIQNEYKSLNMLKMDNMKFNPSGYGFGLARLLLFYVNHEMELL